MGSDRIHKMKLKTHNTCLKKTNIGVGSKIIKLREDRQLLVRFLVIQQSRPQIFDKLGETIGRYEMAITPRSLFAKDGTLLIPSDKSSFMKEIEKFTPVPISDNQNPTTISEHGIISDEAGHVELPIITDVEPEQLERVELSDNMDIPSNLGGLNLNNDKDRVIIIDGQAVVQSMKKSSGMNSIKDFGDAFLQRICRMMKQYSEGRVIFDRYIGESLKDKTRAKRAGNAQPVKLVIHDSTNIRNVSMKLLLSHCETKAQLRQST